MQVWKYPILIIGKQTIEMPSGAKLLTVQMQGDSPYLWAQVDEERPRESRHIAIFGTGHDMPEHSIGDYIATFQMHGGALVFHAFECW